MLKFPSPLWGGIKGGGRTDSKRVVKKTEIIFSYPHP
jgi:hypothetical protein